MHQTWPDAIGVHLMLFKGDSNPYHSRVVWLKGRSTAWFGGEWGWQPATDNCTSWPSASFTNLNLGDPEKNIFCAGHSMLDGPNGGKALVVGGTETGSERGMRFVKTLTPGAGTAASAWADMDSMSEKRWYGTSTTLRTAHQPGAAQALVTTGSKYHHLQMFGGLKGTETTPSDSLVRRFAVVAAGAWDTDVNPRGTRPRPRVGHSGVDAAPGWGAQIYFGGRRSDGYKRDVWFLYRNQNPLASEYDYHWVERVPAADVPPDPRFEHSAVVAFHKDVFVFGGRGSVETSGGHQVYGDLWRLYWGGSPLAWRWSRITPTGPPPGPRFGHTAIGYPGADRMLVFGGVGDTVSSASDNDVWMLTIDPLNHDVASWSKPPLADGVTALKPPARFDHAMGHGSLLQKDPASPSDTGRVAIVYGGRKGPGAAFADTDLWELWYYEMGPNVGKIRWRKHTTAGLAPSPRAGHTMTMEAGSRVAFLFGGENATSAPDDTVHAVDLENSPPTWRRFAQRGFALTNHTALDGPPVFARVPEVFREGTVGSDWERLENSPLVQDWYGFNFVVPGAGLDSSRVFTAGPHDTSRYVTVAASGGATPWRRFLSDTAGYVGYTIGSAAHYRPGRIMRCGMRDTGAPGTTATATTQFIDVTAAAPRWTASANMSVGRVYHNLVILPTGEVLATGGMGTLRNDHNINPRQRPEIWSPDSAAGLGAWYGGTGSAEELALDPVRRGYHSTAILLPDARVLCAGGNHHDPEFEDQHLANIFCPPYLFKADGSLATRPVITGAMATTTWNDTFTVCVDAIAPIQSACLIRPGSTTHGFDQNQRFVPLSIVAKLSSPERLIVAAPAGSDVAPPGDYLLFVLGSADGASVPSIARWVRVTGASTNDYCDVVAPYALTTLTAEWVTQTQIGLSWSATADDDVIPLSGRSNAFDVRYSTAPINTEGGWSFASQASGEPAPGGFNYFHQMTVGGLQSCTWYYVANRASDDNTNLSAIHAERRVRTSCNPGGGGGEHAGRSRSEGHNARAIHGVTAPLAASGVPGTMLLVETTRTDDGWAVTLRRTTGSADATDFVIEKNETGSWSRTSERFTAPADGQEVALCNLVDGRRVALPSDWEVTGFAPSMNNGGQTYALASADHSRLGSLASAIMSDIGTGETIVLRYRASAPEAEAGSSFITVRRTSGSGALAGRHTPDAQIPARFALHQNTPNPFATSTMIRFDLPSAAEIRLEVFDLIGRRIRTLENRALPAGFHVAEWNHLDEASRPVAPGIYVYRLIAGDFSQRRKMTLTP